MVIGQFSGRVVVLAFSTLVGVCAIAACGTDGSSGAGASDAGVGGAGGNLPDGGHSPDAAGTGGGGAQAASGGWHEECGCACSHLLGDNYQVSLDCFLCVYPYEPGTGPFGNGYIDYEWVTEFAACNRRLIVAVAENPSIGHLIDTTTEEIVGAFYTDDSGQCTSRGTGVYAGDLGPGAQLPGCTATSCTENGAPVPCP